MSNHDNHRRSETKRSEHGPRWENGDPGAGCNSTHVARGRRKRKRITQRMLRRNAKQDVVASRACEPTD